jgi:AcrR family transcriptional regulator
MTADRVSVEALPEGSVSRRDRAVARSLDSARLRAEKRVQRFLDAGFEILVSGEEFTVHEVVERSGQSLRSFYQYFEGKYELLLALFEELVRSAAGQMLEVLADKSDPGERLKCFVVEYYRLCQPMAQSRDGSKVRSTRTAKRGQTAAMAEFGQQLITAHPKEASKAFEPIVALFADVLNEATRAGAVRKTGHTAMTTGVILQSIMFNGFATTISGSVWPEGSDPAEEFWRLLYEGLKPS